jgi:hypothetical protein
LVRLYSSSQLVPNTKLGKSIVEYPILICLSIFQVPQVWSEGLTLEVINYWIVSKKAVYT